MKVGIVNYGLGNLRSIANAFRYYHPEIEVEIVSTPEALLVCDRVVLPGVGAFGYAMQQIRNNRLDDAITTFARSGRYLLGICLGMQLLGSRSLEHGVHDGLNLIEGEILPFANVVTDLRIPHMGWNNVRMNMPEHPLFNGVSDQSDFYFVHSYYFSCDKRENILATTEYGIEFASMIQKENIFGAQFHPEKSQENGLLILKNFLELNNA